MTKDTFTAITQWTLLFALRIPVILLGFIVIPIALHFRKTVESERKPLWVKWQLVILPIWAWPWSNQRDGAMGDIRGDYWNDEAIFTNDYLKMFWWLAVRNPANNYSRFLRPNAVDVRTLNIELLSGKETIDRKSPTFQYQFVKGSGPIFNYYGFYCLIPVGKRHINIRIGHKIEPKHTTEDFSADPQKALKGFTVRLLLDS